MSIPKIIHQTLPSKQKIDPAFQENIANLRRLNPFWEHRLYDDEDIPIFISRHFGADTLECFNLIDPRYGAARADFFRYLLMYVEGGVYLDIKSTATSTLDDVLRDDDQYLLSHWRNQPGEEFEGLGLLPGLGPEGEYQQWQIICAARHPFLEAVIENVKTSIQAGGAIEGCRGFIGVTFLTGPGAYTKTIQTMLGKHPHRIVDIQELGFKYSVLSRNAHREKLCSPHYSVLGFPILRFEGATVTNQLISKLSRRYGGAAKDLLKCAFLAQSNGGTARIETFHRTNMFYVFELDQCIHENEARSCLHLPVLFELYGAKLALFVELGGIRIRLGVDVKGTLTSQFDAAEQGAPPLFDIGGSDDGSFTISWREHFLSAEAGGNLVFDRTVAQRWEWFSATYDQPPHAARDTVETSPRSEELRYRRAS